MRANQVLRVRVEPAPVRTAAPARLSEGLLVQSLSPGSLADLTPAWRDLESRAHLPHPFASPEFLIPALHWLAPKEATPLAIWRGASLVGLAVVEAPTLIPIAGLWRSEQAALPAFLCEAGAERAVLEALCGWLGAERPRVIALRLPRLERDGPLARAATELAARRRAPIETYGVLRRAALRVGVASEPASRKHRKEWDRQARRLAEQGRVEQRIARRPDIAGAFLDLEASGWKGGRGTALAQSPASAAFAREMLGAFEAAGRLRAHELTIYDSPIAMGLELRAGARSYFWKTAYDETFAEFSPGVQITREMTRRFEAEPTLELVDSCALADHPMIDRLWPDRLEFVDLAFALRSDDASLFAAIFTCDRLAARLRARLKSLVYAWLGRKRS